MNRHVVDKSHKCNNKFVKNKKGWPGISVRWLLRWYWWRFWQWWRKPKTYFLITNSWFGQKSVDSRKHICMPMCHAPIGQLNAYWKHLTSCLSFFSGFWRASAVPSSVVFVCALDTLKTLVRVFDDWSFCRNTKKTNPIANWGCSWCGVNQWFRIAQQQNPQTCNVLTHELNDIWSLFLQNSNQLGICS